MLMAHARTNCVGELECSSACERKNAPLSTLSRTAERSREIGAEEMAVRAAARSRHAPLKQLLSHWMLMTHAHTSCVGELERSSACERWNVPFDFESNGGALEV